MQNPVGLAQTEQWSWILQTVWGWIWGGLSWIIDWQALVFLTVLFGDSFWQILGKFLLLFFPATVLIAGVWGTMVSLYTIPFRSGRGRFLAALVMSWWDAVRMAWFYWFGLVRFLLVFVGWIWGLLRLGVGLFWRTLKNLVTSPFAMLDSSSRQPAVAGPAGFPVGDRRDPGAGPAGVGGRARHDVVPVRPIRDAGAPRHPRPEGDGRRGRGAGGRDRGRGVLARADQRPQGRARVVQEGGPAPDGAADLAGAAAGRQRVQLLGRRDHGQAALQSAVPVAGPGAPKHADLRDRQDPRGRGRCVVRRRVAALVLGLSALACAPSKKAEPPRSTLVIGLDISGSFRRNPSFNGAIEFASLYIYGHLNGVGGLQPNTAIFVGEL